MLARAWSVRKGSKCNWILSRQGNSRGPLATGKRVCTTRVPLLHSSAEMSGRVLRSSLTGLGWRGSGAKVSVGNLVVNNAGWSLVPDPHSKDEFVRMRGYQVWYLMSLSPLSLSPCSSARACRGSLPHDRKKTGEREE